MLCICVWTNYLTDPRYKLVMCGVGSDGLWLYCDGENGYLVKNNLLSAYETGLSQVHTAE